MARDEQIRVDIVTDAADATADLERTAAAAAELEKSDPEVTVTAEDDATRVLDKVGQQVKELTDRDREIILQAKVGDLKAQLGEAETALRRVRGAAADVGSTTDNTRSVMANFTGNAVQELPGVAGAFGPLGMAAGQFAEYAAEGNIGLKNLAASAGPLAAVALVLQEISSRMAEAAAIKAFRKEQVKEWSAALREGQTRLEVLNDAIDETGELLVSTDFTGSDYNVLPDLAAVGIDSVDELNAMLQLSTEELQRWAAAQREAGADADTVARAAYGVQSAADNMAAAEQSAATTARFLGDAHAGAADGIDAVTDAYERLRGVLNIESSLLGVAGAFDALEDATAAAAAAEAEFGAGSEEASDAQRALDESVLATRESVLTYVEALGEIPPRTATEIDALIDEGSYAEAQRRLELLEAQRQAKVAVELILLDPNKTWGQWVGQGGLNPRSASSTTVTINAPRGMRARDLIAETRRWARRNGAAVIG